MPSLGEVVRRVRETFWWRPATLVVLGLLLAEAFVGLDHVLGSTRWGRGGAVWQLGVDGSRGLLTAIASSMLGAAATAFSITIAVIATASSSYGPRLVRNFMTDRSNQLVLGTFLATFGYALLVLRSVRSADAVLGREPFVPFLSVHLAILFALANIGALVYFIHHISDSIQVPTLVARVRDDLLDLARREYAEPSGRRVSDLARRVASPAELTDRPQHRPRLLNASGAGFVVSLDRDKLVELSAHGDGVTEVVAAVGDHVIRGEPLLRTTAAPDDDRDDALLRCVVVGNARTPTQDARFAVQQLVEMAVRALSPGTNDPYTARNAVQELGAGLTAIVAAGEPPRGLTDEKGEVRLLLAPASPAELVSEALIDLRVHGSSEPQVVREVLVLAHRLHRVGDNEVRRVITRHVRLLLDACARSASQSDVNRLRALAERLGLLGEATRA